MFHYTNEKDMKNFLDKNVVCKTKEDKKMLEQMARNISSDLRCDGIYKKQYNILQQQVI